MFSLALKYVCVCVHERVTECVCMCLYVCMIISVGMGEDMKISSYVCFFLIRILLDRIE